MNRSLEALAILTICLGGTLAVLRISTKDHAAENRAVARQPAAAPEKSTPAKSSSSAVEIRAEWGSECLASRHPDYDHSCGLDRGTGEVYKPHSPLHSPREVAQRAIRSQPLPLIVLPESDSVENDPLATSRSGYDGLYDIAVYGEFLPENELSYRQIESEYAAAELASAHESTNEASAAELPDESLTRWSAALVPLVRRQLQASHETALQLLKHYQRAYVPAYRGLQSRWTEHVSPRLRHFPRPPATARQNLLLRQRAELNGRSGVSWDDYLAFADQNLVLRVEPRLAPPLGSQVIRGWVEQSTGYLADTCELAERMLHDAGQHLQRVARQPESEDIWLAR